MEDIFSNRRFVCLDQKIFCKSRKQAYCEYDSAQTIRFMFYVSSHFRLSLIEGRLWRPSDSDAARSGSELFVMVERGEIVKKNVLQEVRLQP